MIENLKAFLSQHPDLFKGMILALSIIAIWMIVFILRKRFASRIENNELRYRTGKIVGIAGFLLTLIVAAIIFSNRLGGITVALGVAGAGVAFALQEVIASLAGWIAISFGGFYNIGDRVQLGGIKGDVIDIGVLRTTLMETGEWVDGDLYNGRIVRVANSFIFKEPVFNYSGDFPFLWDEIKIPIQYGSDYAQMREILAAVANRIVGEFQEKAAAQWSGMVKKYMIEDARTEPLISLVANDNWVEFTLRYVVDFKKRRITKDQLFTEILTQVDRAAGIKFASATFQLVEAPIISVKVT